MARGGHNDRPVLLEEKGQPFSFTLGFAGAGWARRLDTAFLFIVFVLALSARPGQDRPQQEGNEEQQHQRQDQPDEQQPGCRLDHLRHQPAWVVRERRFDRAEHADRGFPSPQALRPRLTPSRSLEGEV